MAGIIGKVLQYSGKVLKVPSIARNISVTKCLRENYEGDGKTTVTILNREYKYLIMFDSFSNKGFRLNNGIFVLGPVAAFPRSVLQWNVQSVESLTPECLSLFSMLEPKLDLLILGTGSKRIQPSMEVLDYMKTKKINIEILPTEQACSTFNFLNAEGRCIAGALLPAAELLLFEEELTLINESSNIILPEYKK